MTTAVVGSIGIDAFAIEPEWLVENTIDFSGIGSGKRAVQFSDFHYKGDKVFAQSVIKKINDKEPDYVFFTGDLVEDDAGVYFTEALEIIQTIKAPVYGVLGNHDPQDPHSIERFKKAFEATGGGFLIDERVELDSLVIHGAKGMNTLTADETKPKLLLSHYPLVAVEKMKVPYDLILVGHSHGGQVRLPFIGPLIKPSGVGKYVRGLYDAPAGSMYVNVGVGTYLIPVRLLCRPEITEIYL